MPAPLVSVLLPVRNSADTIGTAIASVLAQSCRSFELLVLDDASTDCSADVADSFHDPRVRIFRTDEFRGLPRQLNTGIELATGLFVARMDADDVSRPKRLSAQVSHLDRHPEIGVLGTWIRTFGAVDGSVWRLPTDPSHVAAELVFRSVLAHPTVMFRRSILDAGLRYRTDLPYPSEDWELWQRASRMTLVSNLAEVHLDYHVRPAESPTAAARSALHPVVGESLTLLGIESDEWKIDLHLAVANHCAGSEPDVLIDAERWLLRLVAANDQLGRFDQTVFRKVAASYWFHCCYRFADARVGALRRYRSSDLARMWRPPPGRWARWAARLIEPRRG